MIILWLCSLEACICSFIWSIHRWEISVMVHVDWLNTIGSIDDFRRRFIASSSVILFSVISDIFENMINGEKIKPSEKDSVALKPKTWDPGHTQPFQKLKSTFNFILHTNVTVLLLVCTDILCSKIYNEWSHPATCEGFLFLSFGREKNTFLESIQISTKIQPFSRWVTMMGLKFTANYFLASNSTSGFTWVPYDRRPMKPKEQVAVCCWMHKYWLTVSHQAVRFSAQSESMPCRYQDTMRQLRSLYRRLKPYRNFISDTAK